MRVTPYVFVMVCALCCAAPAHAAATAADGLAAVRAPHPLAADPSLRDPAWTAGKIALRPAFMNLTLHRVATFPTEACLLYDDRALYVAFRAEQRGLPIVAGQATNNVGFGLDDFVGIGVDPGGNGSQVYYFETTPRGTRYQQASENARYAPSWTAAAHVEASAWSAVLVIPLAAMRVHGGPQRWRINLIRGIAANGEHLSWAFDGLMQDGAVGTAWPNFTDVRFWPWVRGITLQGGATRQPRVDLYGLASVGLDRNVFQQANGSFAQEPVRHVGIDAAVPLSDTVTFVGTLAPDFSNVEVDQQTIAPQEFQRQLTEYRPFFAQGAAFLNPNPVPVGGNIAPQNLIFYSPSIGPFDRGAKVEGTVKNDAFGVLSVRGYDEVNAQTFDDVAYGFKHALPDRSFLYWADGVLAHHSAMGSDATSEVGVEGRNLRTGFVWLADTAIEHGTALGGVAHSSNGFLDVHKPNYEINVGYTDVSPRYGPLDGFTAISDIRGPSASLTFLGNGTRVKTWSLNAYGDRFVDDSGAVHEADTLLLLNAVFKNQFSINNLGAQTGVLRSYDVFSGSSCAGVPTGQSSYTGAPCYQGGSNVRYNLFTAGVGYRDGTPTPVDATYAFGPYGGNDVHQFTLTTSRPIAGRFSLGLEYDGNVERSYASGELDSQWLRRISLGASIGSDANLAVSLRTINGNGGFATPGANLAVGFHRHYANGNELYVNFGTPAAPATLDRLIIKYVLHLGGAAGT